MLQKSLKKRISLLITFIYLFSYVPVTYAYHAVPLSDNELDNLCVGGFDFDLDAAYAFRAAFVSQNNISVVSTFNANNININATNQALVRNTGNSAVASQANISLVFSKLGNIVNTVINHLNVADVGNVYTKEGTAVNSVFTPASPLTTPVTSASQLPSSAQNLLNLTALSSTMTDVVSDVSAAIIEPVTDLVSSLDPLATSNPTAETAPAATEDLFNAGTSSLTINEIAVNASADAAAPTDFVSSADSSEPSPATEDLSNTQTSSLTINEIALNASADVAAPTDLVSSSDSSSNASDPTPAAESAPATEDLSTPSAPTTTINEVAAAATTTAAQTNIAVVMASLGNIDNVKINNFNVANVENQGSVGSAVQTNIAVMLAGGTIENSEVTNANIANVVNAEATDAGGSSVTPVSFTQVVGQNSANQILVQSNPLASQVNITILKSLGNSIRNTITQRLIQNQVLSIF